MANGAVRQELWVNDFEVALHQNSPWLDKTKNDSAFVKGKTVHVPEAGIVQNVTKNAYVSGITTGTPGTIEDWNVFGGAGIPLSAEIRNDFDLTYDVDSYETAPFLISDIEEAQTNYNMRQAITGEKNRALVERIGLEALIKWADPVDGSATITTTGSAGSTRPNGAVTGLAITLADLAKAREKIVTDKYSSGSQNICIGIPGQMYSDLLKIPEFTRADAYGKSNLPEGAIGRVLGMVVYEIPQGLILDTNGDIDSAATLGGTVAATDVFGAVIWHRDAVRTAKGGMKLYVNENDAQYYGTVMSMQVLFGASPARTSGKGIAILEQGV